MFRPQALTALGVLLVSASATLAEDEINWAPNLNTAISMAARQNQLVLIHFWAPNCPPCRVVERNVFNHREVANAVHRDFVAVKVNAMAMPDTAKRYDVDRWPMDVIITPAGYTVHSMVSPQDPRQYMQTIHRIAANRRPGVRLSSNTPPSPAGPSSSPAASPPMGAAAQNHSPWMGANDAMAGPQAQSGPAAQPPARTQSRFSQFSQHSQQSGRDWNQPPAGAAHNASPRPQSSEFAREYANPYAQQDSQNRFAQAPQPSAGRFDPRGAETMEGPARPGPTNNNSAGAQTPPAATVNPYVANEHARPGRPTNGHHGGMQGAGPTGPMAQPSPATMRSPQAGSTPPRGLDGFCPVTLVEQSRWQQGDPRFGIVHRGKLYLFAGEAEKQRFWQDPDRYAPVLSGNDPVELAETGRVIEGNRRHGVFFRNQVYLFSSEAALERFWSSPQQYADFAMQAMRQQGMRR